MTRQEYNREASSQATCNWVEVRNQAAIAAMQGLLANNSLLGNGNEYVRISVEYADALIEELKKGETL